MAKKFILKKSFYKPRISRLLIDFWAWFISVGAMLIWRITAEKFVVSQYVTMFFQVFLLWIFVGYFCGKYRRPKRDNFFRELYLLAIVSIITFGFVYYGIFADLINFKIYSKYVAISVVSGMIILNYIFVLLYHGYRYAANINEVYPEIKPRMPKTVLNEPHKIDKNSIEDLKDIFLLYGKRDTFDFVSQYIDIESSNTKTVASTILANFKIMRNFRYDAIINLSKLNSIRGINKIFCLINQKLPDNGLFCCNFETIETINNQIRKNHSPVIRELLICYFFIQKRVLPKIFITSRLWFDITRGKKRIFSRTEILGRLYYCGFELVDEYKSEHLNWIIARRTSQPQQQKLKRYGLIIKLPRIGKNGKKIYFYKMRTMYPYAEYLQKYIYKKHGTDDIGKAKNDIRVTTWGKIFRKFWIDELPMIFNFLKGDLKIVGVRPLSKAFFDTYPSDLQQKRIKIKPGLVPPFYYDLPKTQQEIFESEERYIAQYLKSPLKTDIKYFFVAFYNIIFKKARSH
jgi:lipopolysaccharide/colanic/teichoic acid biosynthesis glycosyltransferase